VQAANRQRFATKIRDKDLLQIDQKLARKNCLYEL
jgi:hypothetical protein